MFVQFKLNKNLDKKIILNFLDIKAAGVDFSESLIKLHPALKSIKNKSVKEKQNFISSYVDDFYKKKKTFMKNRLEEIKEAWEKIEQSYFEEIKKVFNIRKIGNYTAFYSMINACPRWISKKEFCLGYSLSIKGEMQVICHELTHFFFYDYLNRKFPGKLDANQKWHFSEIFNTVLLNQKQFAKLYAPIKEFGYPDHKKFLKQYNKLFNNSKSINDFLSKAIKLTKRLKFED